MSPAGFQYPAVTSSTKATPEDPIPILLAPTPNVRNSLLFGLAAGALIGGQAGRSINDNQRRGSSYGGDSYYTTTETRCSTVNSYYSEERIDEYRVEYSYQGKVYTTYMDQRPGDRIPVRVSVTPAN